VSRPWTADRPATVSAICALVAEGALVKDACAAHGITRAALHLWTRADPALLDAYARAREEQAHAIAEQALEVAHGDDALTLAREAAIEHVEDDGAALKGKDRANHYAMVAALRAGVINRDRMRVDALKWMASKIAPRNYGEKLHTETDMRGALTITVTRDAS
jgi:hypothetical protein